MGLPFFKLSAFHNTATKERVSEQQMSEKYSLWRNCLYNSLSICFENICSLALSVSRYRHFVELFFWFFLFRLFSKYILHFQCFYDFFWQCWQPISNQFFEIPNFYVFNFELLIPLFFNIFPRLRLLSHVFCLLLMYCNFC